jgi:hypothetical protein
MIVKCYKEAKCSKCNDRIKCALTDRELHIIDPLFSKDRQDSFWYNGTVAKIGGYVLEATGDVKTLYKKNSYYHSEAVALATRKKWKDKDLKYLDFRNNNWFEIFDKNNIDSYVCDGDYESAIDSLIDCYFSQEVKGGDSNENK